MGVGGTVACGVSVAEWEMVRELVGGWRVRRLRGRRIGERWRGLMHLIPPAGAVLHSPRRRW